MNLISIGRFSRLTGLSIRALRLYNTEGILEPHHIDPETGYRFYAPEQIELAERIKLLRECEMPLQNILDILKNPTQTPERLQEHRIHIEQRLGEHRQMLLKLDSLLNQNAPAFKVTFRTAPAQHIMFLTDEILWAETNQRANIGKLMGEIYYLVRTNKIEVVSTPFCTYPVPWRKRKIELKACIATAHEQKNIGTAQFLHTPIAKLASTIHYGDYETLPQTLEKLTMWLDVNGYEIAGDVRETYIEHPLTQPDSSQYQTEIAIAIK
jgi:DNA-binding transcriptional MerR regulator